MDKKLLDALSNLSFALEEISDALKSKEEPKSATAKALKGGDFISEIKEISVGIKEIQKDTKKILANQQTIMNMSKSTSKPDVVEGIGRDKESQNNIKDGLASIMLIAVAVLAIGVAFKLIGGVDFISVISLSIALPLLAIGFSKVHKTLKETGFDARKDSANFIIAITAIAMSLTISSWIFSMVTPITFSKLFTVTFIGLAFSLLAPSIFKFISSFKDMTITQIIKSVVAFPLILPAIALGIAFASWAFQLVKPIGIDQFFTAVGISAVFVVISFGIKKMLSAFDKIDPKDLMKSVLTLPLILPAIALAIALSSWVLQMVRPIGLAQFFTTVFIAAAFTIISYGIAKMIGAFKNVDMKDALKASIMLPIVLVSMSVAIMVSSYILDKTADVSFKILLKVLVIGGILAILSTIFLPSISVLGKMNLKDMLTGSLGVVVMAGAIMISSHILSFGNYTKYPDWKWSVGVGLSILAFTPAVLALGIVAMTGIGSLAILAGSGMVLLVAGTIVASSYILSKGKYTTYPPVSWSSSIAVSLASFALGMTVLGTIIVGTFGLGGVMLAAGAAAVLVVARTIVESSFILSQGKYIGGPTKEWASGVSLALGAFSPVYGMLMRNKVLSLLGGGVGPEDFIKAIGVVSSGIVSAAEFFKDKTGMFVGGPSEEWSRGVGLAIGAFAPVYKVLSESAGIFGGPSVEKMSKAIKTISQSIVDSAKILWKGQNYFKLQIDPGYFKTLSGNIFDYMNLISKLNKSDASKSSWFGTDPVSNIAKGMVKIAGAYDKLAKAINNFNSSLNGMDEVKINSFRQLTGNLAMLSAMDSKMFSNMMDVLDKRSGVFANLLKIQNDKTVTNVKTSNATLKTDNKPIVKSPEMERLDKIILLLSNINISVGGVDDYLLSKGVQNNDITNNVDGG